MNLVGRAASLIGLQKKAMGGSTPFDAAGRGRRAQGLFASRLGINTLLYSNADELVARNRDVVRNNCWAAAAIDSYTANAIGKGIRLINQHPDDKVQQLISDTWDRWVKQSDVEYDPANPASGQTDFYGQQVVAAREVMEAGECFIRFRPRPVKEGLVVPLQLQIIEAEQLPVWRISQAGMPDGNIVRSGIEYRPDGRRAAYHFFKAHPGETMFFPMDALEVDRVPATEILHVYRPLRGGQMRGQPWLTSVLAKLYSLDKYMDSEIMRKEVSSMITGFIKSAGTGDPVLQTDTSVGQPTDISASISRLEPGSFQVLLPGEEVDFAEAKDSGDFASFIRTGLQAFASGAGLAEYQVSGDLSHVNYSSIRAGLLEFRRKCEQFQHHTFIFQVCHPVYRRWLRDAMMNLVFGVPLMNQYMKDPTPFEDVHWVTPGWPWVDPDKEIKAFERAVRDGFASRTMVCSSQGTDASDIDAQQAAENKRADKLGLSYDSDGRKVLSGRNAGLTESEIEDDASEMSPVSGGGGAK